MPNPAEKRVYNILELVESAQIQGLDPDGSETFNLLYLEAKNSFLVTDSTAEDYAKSAMQILSDPIRTGLEINRLRRKRIDEINL